MEMLTTSTLINLLRAFDLNLVREMEACSHEHSKFQKPNPFHMEGSVWTHTMMVLQHMNYLLNEKYGFFDTNIPLLCAITHDFGKVVVRNELENQNKVRFFGHEYASVQKAVDFIYFIKEKLNWDKQYLQTVIKYVIPVVSNHLHIYSCEDFDLNRYCGFDPKLAELYSLMLESDFNGQIISHERSSTDLKNIDYSDKLRNLPMIENKISSLDECDLVFYCGLPGSGKDYIAKMHGREIVSLDQIRVDLYSARYKTSHLTSQEIYEKAHKFCERKDMSEEIKTRVQDLINQNKKIALCNRHQTKKSRSRNFNIIQGICSRANYKIGAAYVVCPTNIIYDRDEKRGTTDKTVGKFIIDKFINEQMMPTLSENFKFVEIIAN